MRLGRCWSGGWGRSEAEEVKEVKVVEEEEKSSPQR